VCSKRFRCHRVHFGKPHRVIPFCKIIGHVRLRLSQAVLNACAQVKQSMYSQRLATQTNIIFCKPMKRALAKPYYNGPGCQSFRYQEHWRF
jgi:hypothetical protein